MFLEEDIYVFHIVCRAFNVFLCLCLYKHNLGRKPSLKHLNLHKEFTTIVFFKFL